MVKIMTNPGQDWHRAPGTVRLAIEFLNKAPRDVVYTGEVLAAEVRRAPNTLREYGRHPALAPYRYVRPGRATLYGHPAAITAARKELT